MELSDYTKRVMLWRDSLTVMADTHFFEIMRMYLGEIKTPYNKQSLIDDLSGFLRNEDNQKNILKLLSENDIVILTSLTVLYEATQDKLAKFFEGTFSFAALYERLMNLEERLLIFRYIDKESKKTLFAINPFLENKLQVFLKKSLLFPQAQKQRTEMLPELVLSSNFLAAFFSFVEKNPDLCKTDGIFKKRVQARFTEIFPQYTSYDLFYKTLEASLNLGLIKKTNENYCLQKEALKSFSELSELMQYCYFVGALESFSLKKSIEQRAQLAFSLYSVLPETGFETSVLLRYAYFLQEEKEREGISGFAQKSRFEQLLAQAQKSTSNSHKDTNIDSLIENMKTFGLLYLAGLDDQENEILKKIPYTENQETKNFLHLDASFFISILPGYSLHTLLNLTQFMELRRFDVAMVYEITKQSCMKAFDEKLQPKDIIQRLQQVTCHEIPQNLVLSIEEWFQNYNSAFLYKGFVLKVNPDKKIYIESNTIFASHIVEELANGVYLLDFENDEKAAEVLEKSGLDFIGTTKKIEKTDRATFFKSLIFSKKDYAFTNENFTLPANEEDRALFFEEMRQHLENLNLTLEQKEGLLTRISRKIIVNPKQLRADSVKIEKIEANGMDFHGKIHVAETAIKTENLIELSYDDQNAENGLVVYLGLPLSLEKRAGDSFVKISLEPEKKLTVLSLGKARNVKRIRGSIFKS